MRKLSRKSLVVAVVASFASLVAAEPAETTSAPQTSRQAAERAAEAGAFVAWTDHARLDTQRGLLRVHGGYDTHFGAITEGALEIVALDPRSRSGSPKTGRDFGLAILAAGAVAEGEVTVGGELGLKAQFVFQADSGFDVSAALAYESKGFNTTAAVVPMLLVGTRLGPLSIFGNVAYGHGLSAGERFGAARLAALAQIVEHVYAGVDSQMAMDLEIDDDEPIGEMQLAFQGGPAVTLALNQIALSLQSGLSVAQLRFGEIEYGAVALLGLGAAF